MEKFQQLLNEAAQIKEQQLKKQRKNFESIPQYLKTGLNYTKRYNQLRKQHFRIIIHVSENIKLEGNRLFSNKKYEEACHKYTEALAIYRYITSKSYQNMKDEDMQYHMYQPPEQYSSQYKTHLQALYLNISSCLAKENKKQDALHSADQALKIRQSAKIYYRKAQAYLQNINRNVQDAKLAILYLNKSYEISKDSSIIQLMHRVKKQIESEKDKTKEMFKSMFDKNSKEKYSEEPKQKEKKVTVQKKQKQYSSNIQHQYRNDSLTKIDLKKIQKFADKSKYKNNEQLHNAYQYYFVSSYGSEIYSVLQIYGYKEYLGQYKCQLANILDKSFITKSNEKKRQCFEKYFSWLKNHPIDHIMLYVTRYLEDVAWIKAKRDMPEEVTRVAETKKIQVKEKLPQLSEKKQTIEIKQAQTQTSNKNIVDDQNQKKNIEDQTKNQRPKQTQLFSKLQMVAFACILIFFITKYL